MDSVCHSSSSSGGSSGGGGPGKLTNAMMGRIQKGTRGGSSRSFDPDDGDDVCTVHYIHIYIHYVSMDTHLYSRLGA